VLRAQRLAHADLIRPSRDSVGEHAVQPNRRKHDGDVPKAIDKLGQHPVLNDSLANGSRQRPRAEAGAEAASPFGRTMNVTPPIIAAGCITGVWKRCSIGPRRRPWRGANEKE
jgi:hypothetical protein